MSQKYRTAITTVGGSVFISLPGDTYMEMTPEQARAIATKLFATANEAEGFAPPQVIVFQDSEGQA
jgi:hypothetical protein